jgi:enoyl-CoA hydratase
VEYRTLIVERKESIATITLNQPEKRNAMSVDMGEEFKRALEELREVEELRVLTITGSGRAFCAGGSLDMIRTRAGGTPEENRQTMLDFYGRFLSVRDFPVPTIASINGFAIGAGLCLALACDIRIAADDAMMGMNFVRLGLHPGMGATFMLPRLVGAARACEIFFTGELMTGAEAERIGLVNRAVPPERLAEESGRLAERICTGAPGPMRGVKRAIYEGLTAPLEQVLDYESRQQAANYGTEDLIEGITAAREKREPRFKGR